MGGIRYPVKRLITKLGMSLRTSELLPLLTKEGAGGRLNLLKGPGVGFLARSARRNSLGNRDLRLFALRMDSRVRGNDNKREKENDIKGRRRMTISNNGGNGLDSS